MWLGSSVAHGCGMVPSPGTCIYAAGAAPKRKTNKQKYVFSPSRSLVVSLLVSLLSKLTVRFCGLFAHQTHYSQHPFLTTVSAPLATTNAMAGTWVLSLVSQEETNAECLAQNSGGETERINIFHNKILFTMWVTFPQCG